MSFVRTLKNLILLIVASSASTMFATITLESVSGASYIDTSGATANVYGGIAGNESDCDSTDNVNTCNNCLSGSLLACNEVRVYQDLDLKITIKSSSVSGTVKMFIGDDEISSRATSTTTTTNQSATIWVPWKNICSNLTSDSACETGLASSKTATVGIDSDGDGDLDDSVSLMLRVVDPALIMSPGNSVDECDGVAEKGLCNFEIFPGDEKLYFLLPEDPSDDTTFPTTSYGLNITGIRVFLSDSSFTDATPSNSDLIADLKIEVDSNDKPFVSGNTILDVANDTYYFARIAVTDLAGNVSYFTSDDGINNTNCNTTWTSSTITSADDALCTFVARPGEVTGFLADDFKCFIATAAYGSPWVSKVVDLRNFRDTYLKNNAIGKSFINFYYKHSPKLAQLIRSNPESQPFVRILLWPAWAFATLSLKWGLIWMLSVVTIFSAFLFLLFYYQRHWLHRLHTLMHKKDLYKI